MALSVPIMNDKPTRKNVKAAAKRIKELIRTGFNNVVVYLEAKHETEVFMLANKFRRKNWYVTYKMDDPAHHSWALSLSRE
jgi:hypothetical protein